MTNHSSGPEVSALALFSLICLTSACSSPEPVSTLATSPAEAAGCFAMTIESPGEYGLWSSYATPLFVQLTLDTIPWVDRHFNWSANQQVYLAWFDSVAPAAGRDGTGQMVPWVLAQDSVTVGMRTGAWGYYLKGEARVAGLSGALHYYSDAGGSGSRQAAGARIACGDESI